MTCAAGCTHRHKRCTTLLPRCLLAQCPSRQLQHLHGLAGLVSVCDATVASRPGRLGSAPPYVPHSCGTMFLES